MDILIALVPMVAWGSIGLVSGKIGGDANQQTLGMTMGAFLFSTVVFFIAQPAMTTEIVLIGLLTGLCWSAGQNGQFHGMKYLGVSVGLPLSTGMQLIVNTVAGAIFFHEWQTTKQFIFGFLALFLLVVGAYFTAKQDSSAPQDGQKPLQDFNKGFRALIYSTAGYGAYTIIINATKLEPLAVIFPQSIGMMIGAGMFAFKKTKIERKTMFNMVSGLLWGVGNICMLLTMQKIGLAVSFSLSQMGIIISTIGGIFILGERKTKKELVYVIFGCILIITGGILLGYVKSGI